MSLPPGLPTAAPPPPSPLWRADRLDTAVVGALPRSASASEGLAFPDGLGRVFAPQASDRVLFALVFLALLRRRVARAADSTDSLDVFAGGRTPFRSGGAGLDRARFTSAGEGRKPERARVFPDPVLSNL